MDRGCSGSQQSFAARPRKQFFFVKFETFKYFLYLYKAAKVTNYGYTFETHTVVTEDGYILETFRVCKGSCSGKPVVFLQHGVFNTGQHFLLLDPPRSLGK